MAEAALLDRLILHVAARIAEHAGELTALDRAIGDGDHGDNMRRGFEAVAAERTEIAALPFGAALERAGMTLVMKVGGASGPLFGSALIAMGRASAGPAADAGAAARMLEDAIAAVAARGRSTLGAKTMLDAMEPVRQALAAGAGTQALRAAADRGLADTVPMRATKGRAAFLGERSVGHADPGARSVALIVHAVCDVLEER